MSSPSGLENRYPGLVDDAGISSHPAARAPSSRKVSKSMQQDSARQECGLGGRISADCSQGLPSHALRLVPTNASVVQKSLHASPMRQINHVAAVSPAALEQTTPRKPTGHRRSRTHTPQRPHARTPDSLMHATASPARPSISQREMRMLLVPSTVLNTPASRERKSGALPDIVLNTALPPPPASPSTSFATPAASLDTQGSPCSARRGSRSRTAPVAYWSGERPVRTSGPVDTAAQPSLQDVLPVVFTLRADPRAASNQHEDAPGAAVRAASALRKQAPLRDEEPAAQDSLPDHAFVECASPCDAHAAGITLCRRRSTHRQAAGHATAVAAAAPDDEAGPSGARTLNQANAASTLAATKRAPGVCIAVQTSPAEPRRRKARVAVRHTRSSQRDPEEQVAAPRSDAPAAADRAPPAEVAVPLALAQPHRRAQEAPALDTAPTATAAKLPTERSRARRRAAPAQPAPSHPSNMSSLQPSVMGSTASGRPRRITAAAAALRISGKLARPESLCGRSQSVVLDGIAAAVNSVQNTLVGPPVGSVCRTETATAEVSSMATSRRTRRTATATATQSHPQQLESARSRSASAAVPSSSALRSAGRGRQRARAEPSPCVSADAPASPARPVRTRQRKQPSHECGADMPVVMGSLAAAERAKDCRPMRTPAAVRRTSAPTPDASGSPQLPSRLARLLHTSLKCGSQSPQDETRSCRVLRERTASATPAGDARTHVPPQSGRAQQRARGKSACHDPQQRTVSEDTRDDNLYAAPADSEQLQPRRALRARAQAADATQATTEQPSVSGSLWQATTGADTAPAPEPPTKRKRKGGSSVQASDADAQQATIRSRRGKRCKPQDDPISDNNGTADAGFAVAFDGGNDEDTNMADADLAVTDAEPPAPVAAAPLAAGFGTEATALAPATARYPCCTPWAPIQARAAILERGAQRGTIRPEKVAAFPANVAARAAQVSRAAAAAAGGQSAGAAATCGSGAAAARQRGASPQRLGGPKGDRFVPATLPSATAARHQAAQRPVSSSGAAGAFGRDGTGGWSAVQMDALAHACDHAIKPNERNYWQLVAQRVPGKPRRILSRCLALSLESFGLLSCPRRQMFMACTAMHTTSPVVCLHRKYPAGLQARTRLSATRKCSKRAAKAGQRRALPLCRSALRRQ